jgi:hypothetical protein
MAEKHDPRPQILSAILERRGLTAVTIAAV